jgi:hypothetical protein
MLVLGIEVAPQLLRTWGRWLAPETQPFYVDNPEDLGLRPDPPGPMSPELRDTLKLWNLNADVPRVSMTEQRFVELPRSMRAALIRSQVRVGRGGVPTVRAWSDLLDSRDLRAQADGHRFVWWPSLLKGGRAVEVLARFVSAGRLASRHAEVPAAVWRRSARVLPGAHGLAGTFPRMSGPNCFGTVMAAAGIDGAEDQWMQEQPFEAWLNQAAHSGGEDHQPGTLLVWRDPSGRPRHAAVTLGDGWALEKPSQEWSSPRTVLTVSKTIRSNRASSLRLSRYRLGD